MSEPLTTNIPSFCLALPHLGQLDEKAAGYSYLLITAVALAGIALTISGILGYLNIISSLNSMAAYSACFGLGTSLNLSVLILIVRECLIKMCLKHPPDNLSKPPIDGENPTSTKSSEEKEIDHIKEVFGKTQDYSFSFSLKQNEILNHIIPSHDLNRVYEDRSIYLKHAHLLLLRVLSNHPALNTEACLPGLSLISLTLALKYGEDAAVWNADVLPFLKDVSQKEFNQMEREFLVLLGWDRLGITNVKEMDGEIRELSQIIILPDSYRVPIENRDLI